MKLIRARSLAAFDQNDTTTIVGADRVEQFLGDSAALVRAILEVTVAPKTREEIVEHLRDLAGGMSTEQRAVIEEAIARLEALGAITEAPVAVESRPRARGSRVVLCVSGAISALEAPALASMLLQ